MKRLFALFFMFAVFSCVFAHTGYENDTGNQFIKTENSLSQTKFQSEVSSVDNLEFNFINSNKEISGVKEISCKLLFEKSIFAAYQDDHPAIKIDNIYTLKSITVDNFINFNTYNKDNPGICKSKPSLIIGNNYFRTL